MFWGERGRAKRWVPVNWAINAEHGLGPPLLRASRFTEKQEALGGGEEERLAARDSIFEKGQSKRIWGELYKVVDSSDVIIQVWALGVGLRACGVGQVVEGALAGKSREGPMVLLNRLRCVGRCAG